jgi:hypothetical protein
MAKNKLAGYLNELSKEELINEVKKLYSKFKPVKEYYALELGNDTTALLNEYKRKLDKIFSPRGNFLNPNLKEANSIINQFSKVSVFIVDKIDLMLYKIELIKKFLEEWGHEFSNMVNSFISTYDKVVDLIHENDLEEHFRTRCEEIEAYGMNYFLINNTL